MSVVSALTQEQTLDKEEYKFPDDYSHHFNDNATSNNNSFTFLAMEQESNINYNIILETSPCQDSTSEGSLLSSAVPEINCCAECSDAKFPTALLPQQAPAKTYAVLEKRIDPYIINGKNKGTEATPGKYASDGAFPSTSDNERDIYNSSTNSKDLDSEMAKVQNNEEERIRNIGRSIEWIKNELTVIRDKRFLLTKQFENLFEEIMDFKLRMEMARDEDEQILFKIWEDVNAETRI